MWMSEKLFLLSSVLSLMHPLRITLTISLTYFHRWLTYRKPIKIFPVTSDFYQWLNDIDRAKTRGKENLHL